MGFTNGPWTNPEKYPRTTLKKQSGAPIGMVSQSLTAVNIVTPFLIPAGTLGPNDSLIVRAYGVCSNGSDTYTKTVDIRIGTNVNGTSNASIVTTAIAALAGVVAYQKYLRLTCVSSLTSQARIGGERSEGSYNPLTTINFGVDNYVTVTGLVSNIVASVSCYEFSIEVQKGAA